MLCLNSLTRGHCPFGPPLLPERPISTIRNGWGKFCSIEPTSLSLQVKKRLLEGTNYHHSDGAAMHRGSIRASHPAAPGSNLGAPDFLSIEISSIALRKMLLRQVDGNRTQKKLYLVFGSVWPLVKS